MFGRFNYLDSGPIDLGLPLTPYEHWCPLCAEPPLIFFEEFTGLFGLGWTPPGEGVD